MHLFALAGIQILERNAIATPRRVVPVGAVAVLKRLHRLRAALLRQRGEQLLHLLAHLPGGRSRGMGQRVSAEEEQRRDENPDHRLLNSSNPLRYSPSGNSSATGWSAAAEKRSMIFASAPASSAAPATIDWNSSADTPPEQEKVASRPPGASSLSASRLMSL